MPHSTRPRICIIGAGAIGGLFGVRLAQGHADVSVVARGPALAALREHGWRLESGDERLSAPVRAESDIRRLGPQDVVLLAVKAHALPSIVPLLQPLLAPHTLVVPAVNGVPWWFAAGCPVLPHAVQLRSVDTDGSLHAGIPAAAVLGTVVYPACSSPQPGISRHHSGQRVVCGEVADWQAGALSPRLQQWVALLRAAGFEAEASPRIRTELWQKLLGNACFNPVSLITGLATDQLIDDAGTHALFCSLMGETLALGQALGVAPDIRPAERIAITRRLGHVKTSMLQDAEAGRAVELAAILGAVIELAELLDVPVAQCRSIYTLARMRSLALGLPQR